MKKNKNRNLIFILSHVVLVDVVWEYVPEDDVPGHVAGPDAGQGEAWFPHIQRSR